MKFADATWSADVERSVNNPGPEDNPVYALICQDGSDNGVALEGTRVELLDWLRRAEAEVRQLPF